MEQKIRRDLNMGADPRAPRDKSGELNIKVSVLIGLKRIYNCAYDDFFAGLEEKMK